MALAIVRSSLRKALRGGARMNPSSTRSFSAGASVEEEAREAAKWEKITYVGIVACSVLAFVNLSKGHPHFEEPAVQMVYLKSRNTTKSLWRASGITIFFLFLFHSVIIVTFRPHSCGSLFLYFLLAGGDCFFLYFPFNKISFLANKGS